MNFPSSIESSVDLIRLWRPQALALAGKSKSPDAVAAFLMKRGVPRQEASEAAIEIWHAAQKSRVRAGIPRLVLGWGFILLGAAVASFLMLWRSTFAIAAVAPMLLGASILWGRRLEED